MAGMLRLEFTEREDVEFLWEKLLEGKTIIKVIAVPGRMVNFVVR